MQVRAKHGFTNGTARPGISSPTGSPPINKLSAPWWRLQRRNTLLRRAFQPTRVSRTDPAVVSLGQPVTNSLLHVGIGALPTIAMNPETPTSEPLLAVNNIEVIYNHVVLVLKGVSLAVPERGIVALLGANGAGKTTSLKAISNLLQAERGEVTKGSVMFDGARIDRLDPADVVRRGLIQVMEGRHCFAHLTVEENLLTGAYTRSDGRAAVATDLDRVYNYFPRLKERRRSLAGYTSGGEQQMVAIGRALMARPRLVLLDEPSLGLAPQLVEEIFAIVARLNAQSGVTFLLAEQSTAIALRYAT